MINSLSKDSHITQFYRPHASNYYSTHKKQGNENRGKSVIVSCPEIDLKTPTRTVSFSGCSSSQLAISETFLTLYKNAKEFFKPAKLKEFEETLSSITEEIVGSKKASDSKITEFVNNNAELLEKAKQEATEFVKKENEKSPLDNESFAKKLKEAFNGASLAAPELLKDKPHKFFENKFVRNFLDKAYENQTLFSAGFALLLTCILRPATIMVTPGSKKNSDDKKYAAAHSMASGVIGYLISCAISKPISAGLKKIIENPSDFLPKDSYLVKQKASMNAANTYLNRLPDVLMAAPKAMITIALIPPILKYVFGWEKKSNADKKQMPIGMDYSVLNFKSSNLPAHKTFQNFMGGNK
jgi:hypothetical protein